MATKDLEAARKTAIELKRSLTLELASKDLPGGGAGGSGAAAAADAKGKGPAK